MFTQEELEKWSPPDVLPPVEIRRAVVAWAPDMVRHYDDITSQPVRDSTGQEWPWTGSMRMRLMLEMWLPDHRPN